MSAAEEQECASKVYKVTVCGGLNWDMISVGNRLPEAGETFNATSFVQLPGGKGANTAIAVHRLSHQDPSNGGGNPPRCLLDESEASEVEVHMIGCVGRDKFGTDMKASLRNHFVNVERVQEQGESSAVAVTWVESDTGENRIFVYPGANHTLTKEDFRDIERFGPRPDLVIAQLELNRETVYQLLKTAACAGIDTLLNPSPAHYLDHEVFERLTHLILNETEAAIMTGRDTQDIHEDFEDWNEITDQFLRHGVKYVVVTLGGHGAFCSQEIGKGEPVQAEMIEPEKILDTSGAGDTFVGAYAVRWLKSKQTGKWDFKDTVEYACRAAAQTIQRVGCQEAIPWANQLNSHDAGRLTPTESLKADDIEEEL